MTFLALALLLVQDSAELQRALSREIIGPQKSMEEFQDFIEKRVPAVPEAKSAADWLVLAARLRKDVLEKVFLRGEAKAWSDAPGRVDWQGTIPGGPGYSIRKLRYEAVPGLWIPALLYVLEKTVGRTPLHLSLNGHGGAGKAAHYKHIR